MSKAWGRLRKFLLASQKVRTLPKAPTANTSPEWERLTDSDFVHLLEEGTKLKIPSEILLLLKKVQLKHEKMYKTLGCCRSQFIHSLHVLGKFVSSQSFVQREEKRRQSRRKIGPFLDCLWGENILIHKKSSLDSAAKWSGKTMLICQVLKMSEGIQRNSIKADFTFLVEKLDFP